MANLLAHPKPADSEVDCQFPQLEGPSDFLYVSVYTDELRDVLTNAIQAAGFSVQGPLDPLTDGRDQPVWVCDARSLIARCN